MREKAKLGEKSARKEEMQKRADLERQETQGTEKGVGKREGKREWRDKEGKEVGKW